MTAETSARSPGALLNEALAASRRGDRAGARDLLWRELREEPSRVAAWVLLALMVDKREDVQTCLFQALRHDPGHSLARAWLTRVEAWPDAATAPPPPVDAAPSWTAPAAEDRPRVLVVDDSATVRRLVAIALERLGCDVTAAETGLEALGKAAHGDFDLVLLDIGLPNLDGYQVCRILHSHPRSRTVPVVMLSGRDGMVDKVRGRLAGAVDYLIKPVDFDTLRRTVARFVPERRSIGA
ncbi:MAG TPA: response regulator [Thermoanaerobaculia bacterium]|nr:response regulator [Thermoanaerobaculia bacterium]